MLHRYQSNGLYRGIYASMHSFFPSAATETIEPTDEGTLMLINGITLFVYYGEVQFEWPRYVCFLHECQCQLIMYFLCISVITSLLYYSLVVLTTI